MLEDKKLCIIGAGQMGEALFGGFIKSGIVQAGQIILNDVNIERLQSLKDKYHIEFNADTLEAVKKSDIVLVAVKPQHIDQVLSGAKDGFREDQIVISIAAGVPTEKIRSLIGKNARIVRVMPNTPALVGQGMSVISRSVYADKEAAEITLLLFSSVGEAIELPEDLQNQATAVSGSGPAYFFLMVEALVDAGINAGLDEGAASTLVIQTMAGSAAMLRETGKKPSELREMVTSPGGTTAAALQVFSNHEFRSIVQEAVKAAIQRARELA